MISAFSYIGLLLGLFILTLLIVWQGIGEIFALLYGSGFSLLLLPIVWLPSFVAAVLSWRLLFLTGRAPTTKQLALALWMGRAINTLLPVASIGGEIAKAHLLILWGRNSIDASASVMIDKTVQALALVPWAMIGTGLLLYVTLDADHELIMLIISGTVLLGLGIFGFILIQKMGLFGLIAKAIGQFSFFSGWERITNNAYDVDATIKQIYHNKKQFFLSICWRTLGLILQTAEVWLACLILGHPISIVESMILKSLTSIITDIAFIIPNGYGIQEGGYILFGALLGLTAEFALAISFATRIRELIIDLPGLLYWQKIATTHLLAINKRC